jgi:thiamine biosynthesis lipoprotein
MGCAASVTLVSTSSSASPGGDWAGIGPEALLDRAEKRLRDLEARWSRFLPDSDITRANQAAGRHVIVHPDTTAVVTRSIEAWKQTLGLFDVTVLPALLHHGYIGNRAGGSAAGPTAQPSLAPPVSAQLIGVSGSLQVDRRRNTIMVPAGAAIDLGGIGKGFAADLVAGELIQAGLSGVMVNVGGDLVVRGIPPTGERWQVGIEDPINPPHLIASVALVLGGLATSGTTVRRWLSPTGQTVHHLIDPATATPSTTSLLTATVIGSDGATAEAFATAAMMHEGPAALELLDDVGLAGLLVTRDGTTMRTRSLRSFAP